MRDIPGTKLEINTLVGLGVKKKKEKKKRKKSVFFFAAFFLIATSVSLSRLIRGEKERNES